jgi:hypothetical protein
MRKVFLIVLAVCTIGALIAPAASAATTVGDDSRVTRQRYVRHDGGTDATTRSATRPRLPTTATAR